MAADTTAATPVQLPFARLATFTVAELTTMTAAAYPNVLVRCSNGNAGVACLAFSNGTSWLVNGSATAIAAS